MFECVPTAFYDKIKIPQVVTSFMARLHAHSKCSGAGCLTAGGTALLQKHAEALQYALSESHILQSTVPRKH